VSRPAKVSFELKHDVAALDGRRYILVKVSVHEPAHPKSGLWGDHEISVWVPFRKGATVDSVRAAALKEARKRSAAFANAAKFEAVSPE
jgi:hypothetical protein